MTTMKLRARGLGWLERPADNREVSSSNLDGPIHISGELICLMLQSSYHW